MSLFRQLLRRLIDGPPPPKAFADMDHWERHDYFCEHAMRLADASEGVLCFTGAAVTAMFDGCLLAEVAKVMDESPFEARPWLMSCYLKALSERCYKLAAQEILVLHDESVLRTSYHQLPSGR